ncbi:hypothetical protein A145_14910 [Vibrio splendidus 5S-101]|uniref:hypothetical protein n=1 Tax=Vibrio splendidus TaxID=29497 RepID=UPI0002F6A1BA|nr:hypothetical protein [Vibrio splendidus]OEF17305.1 hypothetical protein A145_14910 [Vibrio splendidus 5S-101]
MSKFHAKIATPPQAALSEEEMLELVESLSSINISELLRDEELKRSQEPRLNGFNAIKVFQNVFRVAATS